MSSWIKWLRRCGCSEIRGTNANILRRSIGSKAVIRAEVESIYVEVRARFDLWNRLCRIGCKYTAKNSSYVLISPTMCERKYSGYIGQFRQIQVVEPIINTLSSLFVGRSPSKWYLKRSSRGLTITSRGRSTIGPSVYGELTLLSSFDFNSLRNQLLGSDILHSWNPKPKVCSIKEKRPGFCVVQGYPRRNSNNYQSAWKFGNSQTD